MDQEMNQEFMRKVLDKVEIGRLGRALDGLREGWKFNPHYRHDGFVEGIVTALHGKKYWVSISLNEAKRVGARCNCLDSVRRGVFCKHIATAAMHELANYSKARSNHTQVLPIP